MAYEVTCPRCGRDIEGEDKEAVASAVVDHAREQHRHRLDREVVLAHLDGVHPHER
jgi:predicted small metal-binding protein